MEPIAPDPWLPKLRHLRMLSHGLFKQPRCYAYMPTPKRGIDYLMGGNASIRKSAVIRGGGWDEALQYHNEHSLFLRLAQRMKPGSRLVIWEHNPFNPVTRLLVRMCPFDGDARLLTLNATRTLLRRNGFRPLQHAYVNLFPPRWLRFAAWAAVENKLGGLPLGAQYWAMFERHD